MQVQPYLFFNGHADEALAFYKKAIGAEVKMLMRFKDAPDKSMLSPGSEDKVMHGAFQVGETTILISDGRNTGQLKFDGFALTIEAKDEADANKMFSALADGGQVMMPLTRTFFSPSFGMLADKFGVNWWILVPQRS